MKRFKDKKVLVTGGSSGIGKAISVAFAREGAKVGINFRRATDKAERLVKELTHLNCEALSLKADVTKPPLVENMIAKFVDRFGPIDILINNAGIGPPASSETSSKSLWDETIDTNLTGMFNVTKTVAPLMKNQSSGKIINISSIAGITGGNLGPAYAASKAGIMGFTRAVARELAPFHINVNTIAPGPILTPLIESMPTSLKKKLIAPAPIGRVGEPKDVAGVTLFLASEEGDFITGQIIVVDGGRTTMGF